MSSIVVGPEQNGQEVRIAPGDSLVLELPENPTTGVRWTFDALDEPLELLGDRYETSAGGGIGAAAVRVLTLKPRGTGAAQIRMKRLQAWEGASSMDATFELAVRIE